MPDQEPQGKYHRLIFRLENEQYAMLRDESQRSGRTVSALLRDRFHNRTIDAKTTKRIVTVTITEEGKQRIALLNRVNANLNMIAKWANTHKSAGDAVQVLAHLAVIEREIADLAATLRQAEKC